MGLTYAEIVLRIQRALSDTAATYYDTTTIDDYITKGLKFVSGYVPYRPASHDPDSVYKFTETLPSGSRTLAMSTALKQGLVGIPQTKGIEYLTDQTTPVYRNYERHGDNLTLLLDDAPSADTDVWVYPNKLHILQSALGTSDTAGAVKTAGAAADETLALKSLGTGTINENTKLTITGDTTVYTVIAQATIATNEATVSIWPPLAAAVTADTVVTLALHDSTMPNDLEETFIDYVVAELHLWRANSIIPETDQQKQWEKHIANWQQQIGLIRSKLNHMTDNDYTQYSRS